ncbi:FkbM family methyltransferase [Candidatus Pelagibacter bacterium]|nr:FkbM family methyltransferase [Candidatus Pelagibacter bacterium]
MLGEDLIVDKFFKNKKKGIYVDVGCYHPIDGNNTYLLFRKGWSGVNIDLNKLSIDLFKRARKNDCNLNVAISNKSKNIKYYYRKKINMLNTINKKFAKSSFRKGFKIGSIQSQLLNTILDESKFKNKKIDFLNLDIEGNEINALESLDLRKYSPKLICIEIHNNNLGRNIKDSLKKNTIYKFLNKKGYIYIWNNDFSYIFKRK